MHQKVIIANECAPHMLSAVIEHSIDMESLPSRSELADKQTPQRCSQRGVISGELLSVLNEHCIR